MAEKDLQEKRHLGGKNEPEGNPGRKVGQTKGKVPSLGCVSWKENKNHRGGGGGMGKGPGLHVLPMIRLRWGENGRRGGE